MEILKIKFRKFEVIEHQSDDVLIARHGKKTYQITKFDSKSDEGKELAYQINRVSTCGVKVPKLYILDKRNGYIVKEYVIGETIMEMIAKNNLDEKVFEQLFQNAYLAKINRITLNYEPDKWLYSDGVLYYTYPYFIIYNEEKDLVKRYLRLWFPTKELQTFLKNNGLEIDKNRMKEEYAVNKEIVLMICKYYK